MVNYYSPEASKQLKNARKYVFSGQTHTLCKIHFIFIHHYLYVPP